MESSTYDDFSRARGKESTAANDEGTSEFECAIEKFLRERSKKNLLHPGLRTRPPHIFPVPWGDLSSAFPFHNSPTRCTRHACDPDVSVTRSVSRINHDYVPVTGH